MISIDPKKAFDTIDHRILLEKMKCLSFSQHTKVTYLGSILGNNLSGESLVTKVLGLINARLKFLYRKQKFLTCSLHRLLGNALVQPQSDLTMLVMLGILL